MKQLSLKRINASSPYDVMMVKSKYLYIVIYDYVEAGTLA